MNDPSKAEADPLRMADDDRFHKFVVCATPIRYESVPSAETYLLFVSFKRGNGKYDIVQVVRRFVDGRQVSNTANARCGIPKTKVEKQLAADVSLFSKEIEKASGARLQWRTLDLSDAQTQLEQTTKLVGWMSRQGTPVSLN